MLSSSVRLLLLIVWMDAAIVWTPIEGALPPLYGGGVFHVLLPTYLVPEIKFHFPVASVQCLVEV